MIEATAASADEPILVTGEAGRVFLNVLEAFVDTVEARERAEAQQPQTDTVNEPPR